MGVIGMVYEQVFTFVLYNRGVPRPAPPVRAGNDQRAPTLEQRRAVSVHVLSCDLTGAPDPHVVGAVHSPAAEVEGDEEVVIVVLPQDVRRFR